MNGIGLVLEGGGMRGLYTAGVLEYFLEQDLFFPYIIGVSAGACMGASYVSKQKGRNKQVNIGLANDPRFLSYRNYFLKRQLFGMDFLFDEIPNKIVSFDFKTFLHTSEQFIVGTTDCRTGKPVYYNKQDNGEDILTIIRASSSIPFIAPSVRYDGRHLLDGGLSDPIPLEKSLQEGNSKNVIIMTKPEAYQPKKSRLSSVVMRMYKRYPEIARLLVEQNKIYLEAKKRVAEEMVKGAAFVIQPSKHVPVRTIERNQRRLTDLYELGVHDAEMQYKNLLSFLTS